MKAATKIGPHKGECKCIIPLGLLARARWRYAFCIKTSKSALIQHDFGV